MPTINQLVRFGRKTVEKKTKHISDALTQINFNAVNFFNMRLTRAHSVYGWAKNVFINALHLIFS